MLHIYIYDISSLRVKDLTFILLTWRKWLAPNNASRQQMGFNSGLKGLSNALFLSAVVAPNGCHLIVCVVPKQFYSAGRKDSL